MAVDCDWNLGLVEVLYGLADVEVFFGLLVVPVGIVALERGSLVRGDLLSFSRILGDDVVASPHWVDQGHGAAVGRDLHH